MDQQYQKTPIPKLAIISPVLMLWPIVAEILLAMIPFGGIGLTGSNIEVILFWFGIFALVGLLSHIVGFIMAIIVFRQIKKNRSRGMGLAITSLILGIILSIIYLLIIIAGITFGMNP